MITTRDKINDLLGSPLSIEEAAKLQDTARRLRRALDHCRIELERHAQTTGRSPALCRAVELLEKTEWLER